jgi:hypothetical protein
MNGDLADCYHHSASKLKGAGYFHKNVADWPKYILRAHDGGENDARQGVCDDYFRPR